MIKADEIALADKLFDQYRKSTKTEEELIRFNLWVADYTDKMRTLVYANYLLNDA